MNSKDIIDRAQEAYLSYHKQSEDVKSKLLDQIALNIELLGEELIKEASMESNLPEARIIGERGRTCGQLRLFSKLVANRTFLGISIDTAIPERSPLPKPDLRKYNIGLGPVMVFGASNFPLAFSTAGGDTASALAAGCSLIYKSNPAHPRTSLLVAGAIRRSLDELGLPRDIFQHIDTIDFNEIKSIIQEERLSGVAFTGSYHGGMSIVEYAKNRRKPIPVFTEMGSINPSVILDFDSNNDLEKYASMIASSVTMGVGQFCTKPGLILGIEGPQYSAFLSSLTKAITGISGGMMLTHAIKKNYVKKLENVLASHHVALLTGEIQADHDLLALPCLGKIKGVEFLKNENLSEEVFGPFALCIEAKDFNELQSCIAHLEGQLTFSIFGGHDSIESHTSLIELAKIKAGRILLNNVPTGVEVCDSMVHGGPFPATSDTRFTSVGSEAIFRWYRPICFQNFPDILLPDELKRSNPLNLSRKINGVITTESL